MDGSLAAAAVHDGVDVRAGLDDAALDRPQLGLAIAVLGDHCGRLEVGPIWFGLEQRDAVLVGVNLSRRVVGHLLRGEESVDVERGVALGPVADPGDSVGDRPVGREVAAAIDFGDQQHAHVVSGAFTDVGLPVAPAGTGFGRQSGMGKPRHDYRRRCPLGTESLDSRRVRAWRTAATVRPVITSSRTGFSRLHDTERLCSVYAL